MSGTRPARIAGASGLLLVCAGVTACLEERGPAAGGGNDVGGGEPCRPTTGGVERCDDFDNDCDRETDEGQGLGTTCAAGVGACRRNGVLVCDEASGETRCSSEPAEPAEHEVCGNGADDDCDGSVDDGCACAPGARRSCYPGPEGTSGVGRCHAGVQACGDDGLWSSCLDAAGPRPEVCDRADDDCDGETDEGFPSGEPCAVGVGPCRREGVLRCDGASGHTTVCSVRPAEPAEHEVCRNGEDDDCNGEVDDGCECDPGSRRPCYAGPEGTEGVGACRAGIDACDDLGRWGGCVGMVLPRPEACNELDDDCDGETDEELGKGEPCAAGQGECLVEGTVVCADDGEPVCDAVALRPEDEDDPCDELDNDCDGEVDEGCTPCDQIGVPEGWSCAPPTGPEGFVMGSPGPECPDGDCIDPRCEEGACPSPEPGRWLELVEQQHRVVVTRPFLIGRTEVTQDEWRSLMGGSPSRREGCGACPVERVSWFEALLYANRLSELGGLEPCYELVGCRPEEAVGTGCPVGESICDGGYRCADVRFVGLDCEGYRLPTEAEWEYATRAGTATAYYTGEAPPRNTSECGRVPSLERAGWFCGNSGYETHPVGEKEPNAWGLLDVHGNVAEWVWDIVGAYEDHVTDPLGRDGPAAWSRRRFRGGGFSEDWRRSRSASRNIAESPWFRMYLTGFRLARTAPPP